MAGWHYYLSFYNFNFQVIPQDKAEFGAVFCIPFSYENINTGVGGEIHLEYSFADLTSVSSAVGKFSNTFSQGDEYFNDINFSLLYSLLNFYFHLKQGIFEPYAGVGIGYFFPDRDSDKPNVRDKLFSLLEENIDNKPGFLFNAGVDMYFSKVAGFLFEVRYVLLNSESTLRILELSDNTEIRQSENINLSTFILNIGLIIKL